MAITYNYVHCTNRCPQYLENGKWRRIRQSNRGPGSMAGRAITYVSAKPFDTYRRFEAGATLSFPRQTSIAATTSQRSFATFPLSLTPVEQLGAMWDDEDNNPYGSFNRRDSETSDAPGIPPSSAPTTFHTSSNCRISLPSSPVDAALGLEQSAALYTRLPPTRVDLPR
jgi:hypothetical protein